MEVRQVHQPIGINEAEIYNGTNWSEVNDMILSQDHLRGFGVSSNGMLSFGGVVYPSGQEMWEKQRNGTVLIGLG